MVKDLLHNYWEGGNDRYAMCVKLEMTHILYHAEKLHQDASENIKIMQDDLKTMCYSEDSCSGPPIIETPGLDCCNIFPDLYQKRSSPSGPICCGW